MFDELPDDVKRDVVREYKRGKKREADPDAAAATTAAEELPESPQADELPSIDALLHVTAAQLAGTD